MNCSSPIDFALLADYWSAHLDSGEESNLEEHLFACADCSGRLEIVAQLADGIRALVRSGALFMTVNPGLIEQARREGLRVRAYALDPGAQVDCTITLEDDLLIGRLAAKLSGASRLDLSLCDLDGQEFLRLADIPFLADSGEVIWQHSSVFAKAAPSGAMRARLYSVAATGEQSLLGEYTFHHTRTID